MKKFNILVIISVALTFVACNRDFEYKIDTDETVDTEVHQASSQNKVLYVVVNNGIGKVIINQSVRDNVYPNINQITQTAIFSGASLTGSNDVEATTYADMFTSVRKDKHGVLSETGNNNLSQYPSFVDNIFEVNSKNTTSAFVQSEFIYNNLVNNAATKKLLSSDTEVQAAAVSDIATTKASVVVAQFTGLKKAGEAYGYGPNSDAYLNALQSLDSFIGALLDAISDRTTIGSENWVVIVASNKGGQYQLAANEDDGSVFSDTERNGFIIISSPKFNLDYYPIPNVSDYTVTGTSPEELGPEQKSGVIEPDQADIYNLESSGEYTIQFKANFSNRGAYLPSIMSKSSSPPGNSPNQGWAFVLHSGGSDDWDFRIGGRSSTGPKYDLGVWNTFTARIYENAGKRYLKTYLNDKPGSNADITDVSGATVSSLIVGGAPSYGAYRHRVRMTDIRIYNTALPESYIMENYCETFVNSSEPYAENLIGYWPGMGINSREPLEKLFLDFSPNKRNIKFRSGAVWGALNLTSGGNICTVYPDLEINKIPFSVDMPRFIYTWLGIFNVDKYDLDGKLITPSYRSTGSTGQ